MAEQFDTKEQIGSKPDAVVRRWIQELELAGTAEKDWRTIAAKAIKRYEGGHRRYKTERATSAAQSSFNILWSNVETLRPAIYAEAPKPDVRRRFRDRDPLGKAVAEVTERALIGANDEYDCDVVLLQLVQDMLLPGRGVAWVRYDAQFAPDGVTKTYEKVYDEHVQWDDFRRGPGKTWDQVPWVARRHRMTRATLREKFPPEIADKVPLDCDALTTEQRTRDERAYDQDLFRHAEVWEIWNKDDKQVEWIASGFKEGPCRTDPDPLQLKDFFPTPRPLYAVPSSTTLVPCVEYDLYEEQAIELDRVTRKINRIVIEIKTGGIYDATMQELAQLTSADDGAWIAARNVAAIYAQGGSIDKSMWPRPVEQYARALIQLYEARDRLKAVIYEITGISDLLRGQSVASETATAQSIKSRWGALRIQDRQKAIQRYARDLTRLKAEIICEQFSQETLATMTNLQFPTMQEKQAAQMVLQAQQQAAQMQEAQQLMAAQQAQQQLLPLPPSMPPAPPDPELQRMASAPSWEEILQVMQSDQMRCYVIDVETDFTAAGDVEEDQKNVIELLGGITTYMTAIGPAVTSGMVPVDSAKTILLAAVRRFKMGDEVEDAIDQIGSPATPALPGAMGAPMPQPPVAAPQAQAGLPAPGQPMAPAAPAMIQ